MKFLISLGIVIAVALLGSRLSSSRMWVSMGVKNILLTGVEYIFLGILLGRFFLNIIDETSILKFRPFLIFGLSWIGFLFGIQFEFRLLRKLPRKFFSVTLIQAIFTFASVFSAVFFLVPLFSNFALSEIFVLALFFGSISVSTAPSALSIVNRNYRFRNQKLCDLMRYISGVDSLFSILFFSFLISYLANKNFPGISFLLFFEWFGVTILIGIAPSFIFSFLLKLTKNHSEFIALLIGIIAFTGGIAFQLHHSSLVAGFFGGFVVANICRKRVDAIKLLREAENSIYIIILLLLGAGLDLSGGFDLMFFLIFFLFRVFGKLGGNFLALKLFPAKFYTPGMMGLALLSEGSIGFAILINFYILFPEYSKTVIVIALISAIITELMSPKLILTQFREKFLIEKKEKNKIKNNET